MNHLERYWPVYLAGAGGLVVGWITAGSTLAFYAQNAWGNFKMRVVDPVTGGAL